MSESNRSGIYYGAIGESDTNANAGPLQKAIRAGNVNISDAMQTEVLELSETSRLAQEKHAVLLKRVEAERRARKILVPTAIVDVMAKLRHLGQPITLFGENAADRRERLRKLMSRIQLEGEEASIMGQYQQQEHQHQQQQQQEVKDEEMADAPPEKDVRDQHFYIPIPNNALKMARIAIAEGSFLAAKDRLNRQRRIREADVQQQKHADEQVAQLYTTAKKLMNHASQVGDMRTLSCVRYATDGQVLATGSWSGACKIWNATTCALQTTIVSHKDRITGLAWSPTMSQSPSCANAAVLVTASADATAKAWSLSHPTTPLVTFTGHQARLGKIAYHPSGLYIGTTSFDQTWRLWHVETGQELLLQEGHYKEVYAIAFQCDGSLVATGDLNGIGRVWDLRSGKSILALQGHSKQILCMDFSSNGYTLATGSDDHSVRVWDVRKKAAAYVLPAHSSLVSDVRFSPRSSELFATASFDASVKVWRTRGAWDLVTQLKGHEGKVTSVDFAPREDGRRLVTCGFDRTFKLWAREEEF